jgi:hypothetical protein
MAHTRDKMNQTLAERLGWQLSRRDDSRVAGRLYRKQVVDGVYRLDKGTLQNDFFRFLNQVGTMALLAEAHGMTIQRGMAHFVPGVLLDELKAVLGIASINVVVVRISHRRGYGPEGKTVFLTIAMADKPWRPFDDAAERRLHENYAIKEGKQQ